MGCSVPPPCAAQVTATTMLIATTIVAARAFINIGRTTKVAERLGRPGRERNTDRTIRKLACALRSIPELGHFAHLFLSKTLFYLFEQAICIKFGEIRIFISFLVLLGLPDLRRDPGALMISPQLIPYA